MSAQLAPPPTIPSTSIGTPVLPVSADPTLVPQHTSFQTADPILHESLSRIDSIAISAKNAFDTHMEKNPDTAAKYMFHMLRAEKLRLEVVKTYSELALEARKVVSTDDKVNPTQAAGPSLTFSNLPPELEQVFVAVLGRKQTAQDVYSGTSLDI